MRWMIIGAFLIVRPGCSQPIEKPRPAEPASGIVEPESVNVEPAVTTTVNTLALRRAKLEEAASTVVFPTTEANAWLILKSGAARVLDRGSNNGPRRSREPLEHRSSGRRERDLQGRPV
jgi:hypothetical protein